MGCTIGGAPRGRGGFDSIESAQKVKGRHHNRDLLENCCTLKIEGCTIGGAPRGKVFTEEIEMCLTNKDVCSDGG